MKRRSVLLYVAILLCLQSLTVLAQVSQPQFGVVNWARVERQGEAQGIRLFLNVLRLDPTLLDDEVILKHFIAVNNCDNGNAVIKGFASEFDYPKMVAFYKAKAPEILKSAPTSLHDMIGPFFLGKYDAAKGAFPFVDRVMQKKATTLTNVGPGNDLQSCGVAGGLTFGPNDPFYGTSPTYEVHFKPVNITELPMDEASAQKFVGSLRLDRPGSGRTVFLVMDLEILQQPAKLLQRDAGGRYSVDFPGEVKKITVIGGETHDPIGVLLP